MMEGEKFVLHWQRLAAIRLRPLAGAGWWVVCGFAPVFHCERFAVGKFFAGCSGRRGSGDHSGDEDGGIALFFCFVGEFYG